MIQIKDLLIKKEKIEINHLNLQINPGECYVLLSSEGRISQHIFNIFYNLEEHYLGQVSKKSSVLVDVAESWPAQIQIRHIQTFFQQSLGIGSEEIEELMIRMNILKHGSLKRKMNELTSWEKLRFLLGVFELSEKENFFIKDSSQSLPIEIKTALVEDLQRIKKNGGCILYFSSNVFLAPEIGDRIGFMKKGKLLLELSQKQIHSMDLKDLHFQFLSV